MGDQRKGRTQNSQVLNRKRMGVICINNQAHQKGFGVYWAGKIRFGIGLYLLKEILWFIRQRKLIRASWFRALKKISWESYFLLGLKRITP